MALSIGRSVFCVLFPISKIISIFLDLSRKDENSASKVKESKTKPESAIQNSEMIIACVILIIGIIAASLEYKKLAWLFITATVITFIYHIAGIYMSIGIIGRVVLSEKADRLLIFVKSFEKTVNSAGRDEHVKKIYKKRNSIYSVIYTVHK